MSNTIYELQKRTTRWHHIGYFRTRQEAVREQFLPIGYSSVPIPMWRIVEHEALLDPDQPDQAFLVNTQEVPLGRTAFFI